MKIARGVESEIGLKFNGKLRLSKKGGKMKWLANLKESAQKLALEVKGKSKIEYLQKANSSKSNLNQFEFSDSTKGHTWEKLCIRCKYQEDSFQSFLHYGPNPRNAYFPGRSGRRHLVGPKARPATSSLTHRAVPTNQESAHQLLQGRLTSNTTP